MNVQKEQRLNYARFYKELDIAIRAAGGVGFEFFTDSELEKMSLVFAHNDIHIRYEPKEKKS